MLQNLEINLQNHTLDELKTIYKIPKSKLLTEIENAGLKVIYDRRTPYSKVLIPINDKIMNKYGNKSKRKSINKLMMSDCVNRGWPDCEIKERQELIKQHEFSLGRNYSMIAKITSQINSDIRYIKRQQFLINVLNMTVESADWCGYVEEERYGGESISDNDMLVPILNDNTVLGYLSEKLPPEVLSLVSNSLHK